jgi:membrane-bound serine protease (ClpP class)
MKPTFRILLVLFLLVGAFSVSAKDADNNPVRIYRFDINREIGPAMWRFTNKAIREAESLNANYILIRMNTYGGELESADSIRTRILNCRIPVLVYIDNNAASAGALISLAADSIYMRTGATIGAATVVNQTGEALPDKYQSYMRAMMRATAESHGKIKTIVEGDTVERWFRDPHVAEAMVDPRIRITGVNDSGKVLTFTTEEALRNHFCEGQANSIDEVLKKAGINNYTLVEQKLTSTDKAMGWLVSPVLQGILIMIIVAGIYFEMQSPGLAFPIIAAIGAALLYFAPLYLEGLAANWEIILFVAGLVLIALEVFVIPGFGITGIAGIICVILGLTLSLLSPSTFGTKGEFNWHPVLTALSLVVISIFGSLIGSLWISSKLFTSRKLPFLALHAVQDTKEGFVGTDISIRDTIGKTGIAETVLRPSGSVEIDGHSYDAVSLQGFIAKGTTVNVIKIETGQIYVVKAD